MSTLGKILVGLVAVFSFVVLGSAATLLGVRSQTQADVERLEGELDSLQAELDQARSDAAAERRRLETEKSQLQDQNADLEVARENAERNASRKEADNQQLLDDLTKVQNSVASLEQAFSTMQARNAELEDQNDALRADKIAAEEGRRQAEQRERDMRDERDVALGEVASLEGRVTDLSEQTNELDALLEVAKASGFDVTSIVAAPHIEASVVEVDHDYGFVVLDKGGADGVERGFTFEVHRPGAYLGRVRVDDVHENYATASIVYSTGAIQRFDSASTYLN